MEPWHGRRSSFCGPGLCVPGLCVPGLCRLRMILHYVVLDRDTGNCGLCKIRNNTASGRSFCPADRERDCGRPAANPCQSSSFPFPEPAACSAAPWTAPSPLTERFRRLWCPAASTGSCAARPWRTTSSTRASFSRRPDATRRRQSGSPPAPAIPTISCLSCPPTTGSTTPRGSWRPSSAPPRSARPGAGSPLVSTRRSLPPDMAISRFQNETGIPPMSCPSPKNRAATSQSNISPRDGISGIRASSWSGPAHASTASTGTSRNWPRRRRHAGKAAPDGPTRTFC